MGRFEMRAVKIVRAIFPAVGLGILLGLIPASTPYGAIPFYPDCPADPPPPAGRAALWFPEEPEFALRAGLELLSRAEYPAAACYLKRVEGTYDADPKFHENLGEAYWGAGEKTNALAEWEQALKLNPDAEELYVRLWTGYIESESWNDAERTIERLLQRGGDHPEAEYRLALIRAARNPGGALELLDGLESAPAPYAGNARILAAAIRAAIARKIPEYIFAKTGQGLLGIGEPRLAEVSLRLAIDRNPKYGEAFALLGLAQEQAGKDPEDSYRRAVALAPDSATACLLYGAWLRRRGDLTLARWWLTQAWDAQPGDWIIAAELAQVDWFDGNIAEAESWLVRAVEAHPKAAEAWLALAAFYIENDFHVEYDGIPAARQAVELAPDDDRALDMLGWGWFKLGDFSAAERMFLRALERNPDSASAHLHLGLCYAEQGRAGEARAEWEAAMRLDPDGGAGKRARELLAG